MKKRLVFVVGLTLAGLAQAGASDHVSVIDPYVRLAPPNALATGAYMTLKNSGDAGVRLVKASNPVSRATELHTHINDKGMMKMRPVASIDIKPMGEAVLLPGGLHVMLIDLTLPLREGDLIPLTLTFDDGSSLLVEARVVPPGARPTSVAKNE
jgi:copper(I)-binding protein